MGLAYKRLAAARLQLRLIGLRLCIRLHSIQSGTHTLCMSAWRFEVTSMRQIEHRPRNMIVTKPATLRSIS